MPTFYALPAEIHFSISHFLSRFPAKSDIEAVRGHLSLLQASQRYQALYQPALITEIGRIFFDDFATYKQLYSVYYDQYTNPTALNFTPIPIPRREQAPTIEERSRDVLSIVAKEAPLEFIKELYESHIHGWDQGEGGNLWLFNLLNMAVWWKRGIVISWICSVMFERKIQYNWLAGRFEYGYDLSDGSQMKRGGPRARVGPFVRVLVDGDIEMAELLNEGDWGQTMGTCRTNSGKTALHYAAQFGQYDMVMWLLDPVEDSQRDMVPVEDLSEGFSRMGVSEAGFRNPPANRSEVYTRSDLYAQDDYCWNVVHHTVNSIPYNWDDSKPRDFKSDEKIQLLKYFRRNGVDLEYYLIGGVTPFDGMDIYALISAVQGGIADDENAENLKRVEDKVVEDSALDPFRRQTTDISYEVFPPLLMLSTHWRYCGGCKDKEECEYVLQMTDALVRLITGRGYQPNRRHLVPFPGYGSLALGIIRCKLVPEYRKEVVVRRILETFRREDRSAINQDLCREDGTPLYWAIIQTPMPSDADGDDVDYSLVKLLLDYGARADIGVRGGGVRPMDIAKGRGLDRAVHWIKYGTRSRVPKVTLRNDFRHTPNWNCHLEKLYPFYIEDLIKYFHKNEPVRESYIPPNEEQQDMDGAESIHSVMTSASTQYSIE